MEQNEVQKKKKGLFAFLANDLKEIGVTYKEGGLYTWLSTVIFGLASMARKQFLKGFALFAAECGLLYYIIGFGWQYLTKIDTLGTVKTQKLADGTQQFGDNSFLILLYGILTIFAIFFLLVLWRLNIKASYLEMQELKAGRQLPGFKKSFASLFDKHFDKTLLAIPVAGIFIFTVLPIIFMICIAFTNYDKNHQSPTNLFTWVGLENFKQLFSVTDGLGSTFVTVLGWTLVWALFATFLNYFLGIGVAMLINKKGIRFKKLWRTILVVTIAVPQFVSLLYITKMFAGDGLINTYLLKWGWIDSAIPFWTNKWLARIMIIVINLWIGIPYLMLISTGILMNIPEDLYESAKIDGASGWQSFLHITMPYMLFVTGPYLLTSFIGNLNNFNVIFLLTKGGPTSMMLKDKAGYTDLLVTWLYKMTVDDTNYRMAAVLGITVFVVVAVISLVVYRLLPSVKDEEGFQ